MVFLTGNMKCTNCTEDGAKVVEVLITRVGLDGEETTPGTPFWQLCVKERGCRDLFYRQEVTSEMLIFKCEWYKCLDISIFQIIHLTNKVESCEELKHCLKSTFECFVCTEIVTDAMICTGCCHIVGCQKCIATYMSGREVTCK